MPKKVKPHVIDLFAGVGGLSLGAARAGFNIAAAVEFDKHAIASHKLNFPKTSHVDQDISLLTAKKLLEAADLQRSDLSGIIGGPPCQGFSSIGRRSIDDPRNSLFSTFFQLVAQLRPAFFVAENVPGILNERNDALRESALAHIPKSYKVIKPFKVKASEYGAPTIRTRVFFIGYDPKRVNALTEADFLPNPDTQHVKVASALAGIPSLGATWESGDGWKAVSEADDSHFGLRLKAHIPADVGHKDSIKKYKEKKIVSGFVSTSHTPESVKRFNALQFGKADKVSKSVRLNPDGFCPTLRAGTGPEKGSYQAVRPIHPIAPRVICPREAARLQGFPDWFQFDATKWHAFRQIGNSVSPIVAEAILAKIIVALKTDES